MKKTWYIPGINICGQRYLWSKKNGWQGAYSSERTEWPDVTGFSDYRQAYNKAYYAARGEGGSVCVLKTKE